MSRQLLLRTLLLVACMGGAHLAHALTPEAALAMAEGDSASRIAAMQSAVAEQPDARTAVFLRALADGEVVVADGRALVVRDGQAQDPATGQGVPLPEGAEDVSNNNRMRRPCARVRRPSACRSSTRRWRRRAMRA
jgi:urea transport system permease protein